MAKRGKCVNIDCDHYKEEFDIQAGEEFVCPHCQKPLSDVEGKGKDSKRTSGKKDPNWKPIAIIAAAVLVLGGLGYGGYAIYHSYQENEQEKAALQSQAAENANALRQKEIEDSIKAAEAAAVEAADAAEKARRAAALADAQAKGDSIIKVNEKLLEEKGKKIREDAKNIINSQLTSLRTACQTLQYENIALIDTMEVAINEAWKNAEKPTIATGGVSTGKVSLGYGTYEGPVKSGQPHGMGGTIRISSTYSIDLKKASGEMLQVNPGDIITSVKMENGRLIQGQLKRTDGTERWIIIG